MVEHRIQHRLAAVLAADVVGYSQLMGEDETGTLATLRRLRDTYITPLIAEHDGRLVKLLGDGFLVEFASVIDAVACALAWQKGLLEMEQGGRMRFRIGINMGEIVAEDDDIYGDGVNIAARLESIAPPGGISISSLVHHQVGSKIDAVFKDRGEQKLKNIEEPVRVYAWEPDRGSADQGAAATTAGVAAQDRKLALPAQPSIAVLPFDNLSGDPQQDFLSDGLTESLITTLAKASGLFVIARNTTFAYKGKATNVQQISQELGVCYVLEGSVQRIGDRIRINAQLIDGRGGQHLWAERYDRNTDDLFALQDAITVDILTACQVKLTEGEQARMWIGHDGPVNLAAVELHWQAIEKFRRFNKTDNGLARALLERCIAMDGDDAMRLSLLGYTHMMDAKAGWSTEREESLALAQDFAKRAEQLDPLKASNKSLQANLAQLRGDFDAAVALAREAVALEPNSAEEHYVLGIMLSYAGQPGQAVDTLGKAMRLSPYFPMGYLYQLGIARYLLRQYEEALAAFKTCVARNPESRSSYVWMAILYAETGKRDEASACVQSAMQLDHFISIERWVSTEPFKDPKVVERMTEALRLAGLPD